MIIDTGPKPRRKYRGKKDYENVFSGSCSAKGDKNCEKSQETTVFLQLYLNLGNIKFIRYKQKRTVNQMALPGTAT